LKVYDCKELLTAQSEELSVIISCFKETQITANQKLATMRGDKSVNTIRANEICFKYAKWRLTEADGQLGIADLILSNFLSVSFSFPSLQFDSCNLTSGTRKTQRATTPLSTFWSWATCG